MYRARSGRNQKGNVMGIDGLPGLDNQRNIPGAGFGHRLPCGGDRQQRGQSGSLVADCMIA